VIDSEEQRPGGLFPLRALIGGFLMGLANLVPGISGGTMLLASGIYPHFIRAVAEVSTFRFTMRSILVLGSVVLASVTGVVLLAGTVKSLVVEHRWIMYSLFIGLTLGGIPIVWRMVRPPNASVWMGAIGGFLVMAFLALAQQAGVSETGSGGGVVTHGLAGLAGASAMILPGVSGGYLLLVLGEYIPILSAIDAFKIALKAGDMSAAMDPAVSVLLPVGVGVVLGVVMVSNLLKWLLARFPKPTLGVLLGLLVGAVVGLWPFQQSIDLILDQTVIKGQVVTAENLIEFALEDYPTEYFTPSGGQVGAALAFILLGMAVTLGISRFSRDADAEASTE